FLSGGCCLIFPTYKACPVVIEAGSDMSGREITVDVVGVIPKNSDEVHTLSVDKYWADGSPERQKLKNLKVTYYLDTATNSVRLEPKSSEYSKWMKGG